MEFMGNFGITVSGKEIKGYMDDGKVYLDATELRELAKACLDVAEYLEAPNE
jgi:hypothetical protein